MWNFTMWNAKTTHSDKCSEENNTLIWRDATLELVGLEVTWTEACIKPYKEMNFLNMTSSNSHSLFLIALPPCLQFLKLELHLGLSQSQLPVITTFDSFFSYTMVERFPGRESRRYRVRVLGMMDAKCWEFLSEYLEILEQRKH